MDNGKKNQIVLLLEQLHEDHTGVIIKYFEEHLHDITVLQQLFSIFVEMPHYRDMISVLIAPFIQYFFNMGAWDEEIYTSYINLFNHEMTQYAQINIAHAGVPFISSRFHEGLLEFTYNLLCTEKQISGIILLSFYFLMTTNNFTMVTHILPFITENISSFSTSFEFGLVYVIFHHIITSSDPEFLYELTNITNHSLEIAFSLLSDSNPACCIIFDYINIFYTPPNLCDSALIDQIFETITAIDKTNSFFSHLWSFYLDLMYQQTSDSAGKIISFILNLFLENFQSDNFQEAILYSSLYETIEKMSEMPLSSTLIEILLQIDQPDAKFLILHCIDIVYLQNIYISLSTHF